MKRQVLFYLDIKKKLSLYPNFVANLELVIEGRFKLTRPQSRLSWTENFKNLWRFTVHLWQ